ncbi:MULTISPECIES: prephenate dehydrogenase/arogenate dehydrogenase family protein [unclassified Rhodococcus (in: high G+C Gram-positive bacteria)]|uniref:prephenate dehydrogenase/arogenate dehydrogenase family protein n=1 Tax=unclassified Rhodococcus (in: high G+C Gram-positive bacteria) TaxID=192944 RepID=UPI001639BE0D|nr:MULTISPECIES: prephenate dehydrogenase/arogenate dehydrogenase family protein [unclassified Rhodococcus (in: high G+C Gram-positive bacteria)]MBC2643324.1 prephenate dehydrogenase [Rhodococcus sp. 3A]MBC2891936.1 prephenate dehydrogenase [Rhodococcus sp. 4CII]
MNAPAASARTVALIGGSGDVGRMLATRLRDDGNMVRTIDVRFTDRSDPDQVKGDVTDPSPEVRAVVSSSDAVILAIPEGAALDAIPFVVAELSTHALLVDTLSVKSRFAAALRDSALRNSAVGINPMFAPSLAPEGRPIAAVTYRDGGDVDWFLSSLSGWGSSVVRLDAENHDRLTAATQALTHAGILAFGLALAELGVDGAALTAVGTPPHLVSLALLARVGGGVPEVYRDIQAGNPFAGEARRALAAALATLTETVEQGTEDDFASLMTRSTSTLGDRSEPLARLCADLFTDLVHRQPRAWDRNGDVS